MVVGKPLDNEAEHLLEAAIVGVIPWNVYAISRMQKL